jgi:hypothetical protein
LAHVDPEFADRRLRERLEQEERRARQRRGFTLSADGFGGMRVSGVLDVEGAAIVSAALEPLSTPIRGADAPNLRTAAARRADALVDVCRIALASGGLPDNGGQPPQLNVTVDFDALRREVAVGGIWIPVSPCRQASSGASRAALKSCRRFSMARRCRSTSGVRDGSTAARPDKRSCCATAAARSRVAIDRRDGRRSTTSCPGWTVAQPIAITASRCAPTITG